MYLSAICFFCSTLFAELTQGDILGNVTVACVWILFLGPPLISATVRVGTNHSLGSTYQPKHSPFPFPFCTSRASMHGWSAWKSEEWMPLSLGKSKWMARFLSSAHFLSFSRRAVLEALCTLPRRSQQNGAPAAQSSALDNSPYSPSLSHSLFLFPASWDHLPWKRNLHVVQVLCPAHSQQNSN